MFSFLKGIYILRSEIAEFCDNYIQQFLKNVLQEAEHFTFPLTGYKDSSFSTSLLTLASICLFDCSHPRGCEVVSSYDFAFPVTNDVEQIFMCLLAICVSSWINVYLDPLQLFNRIIYLFIIEFCF